MYYIIFSVILAGVIGLYLLITYLSLNSKINHTPKRETYCYPTPSAWKQVYGLLVRVAKLEEEIKQLKK